MVWYNVHETWLQNYMNLVDLIVCLKILKFCILVSINKEFTDIQDFQESGPSE